MILRNAIFEGLGARLGIRFVPLFAAFVLLLNLAACDVLDGNEPDRAGDPAVAEPPDLIPPVRETSKDPILVRILAGDAVGAPERREFVSMVCVVNRGSALSKVEVWTSEGQVHVVQYAAEDQTSMRYEYELEIVVAKPEFVYMACTNKNGKKVAERVDFSAPPPPAMKEISGPDARTHQTFSVRLADLYYRPEFRIIGHLQLQSARVENGVLYGESLGIGGVYEVNIRVTTPFGTGDLILSGNVHERERVTTWANTAVTITFLDAEGVTVHRMGAGAGVSAIFADSAAVNAVRVRISAQDGNHFSATRPFAYPAFGRTVALNAYLVPMEPCRRFGNAWGRSISECRELLAGTLFSNGYTRYKKQPEAIVAAWHPISRDLLPPDWAAIFEEIRLSMAGWDVYLDRLPAARNVWASQLKDQGGNLVPAETGRVLVLPDAQAMQPSVHYARDAFGFTTGAVLTLPVSQVPDHFRSALTTLMIRAWYPYTDSDGLAQLPSVQQRHFIETVIVPLRVAEDGVIGLSPGDRAEDVLIM